MQLHKAAAKTAVMLALAISSGSFVYGAEYKDVPSTHWAYSSIDVISSKGLLAGDMSGNFNPDSYIDKFTTSKVLAAATGYDYNSASLQEKANYDAIYNSYKAFLDQYINCFSKWNSSSDKEIAYLLSKNLINTSDLNQFIIKTSDGTEKVRALSREEAAVFLVRLMGKTNEAEALKNSKTFADDGKITETRKGSVYYLKGLGILNGDSNGCFNPKSAVTRAEFCVILDKTLANMGKTSESSSSSVPIAAPEITTSQTSYSNSTINNVTSISGTTDKYFPAMNVIQLNTNGEIKLYRISGSASIRQNGAVINASEIPSGASFKAIINNSEIVQLDISQAPVPVETENNSTQNLPDKNTELCTDVSAEGKIETLLYDKYSCIIGINSGGTVKNFKADGSSVPLYSLRIGDSVKVTAENGKISLMEFQEFADRQFKTGYIKKVKSDYISVENLHKDEQETRFYFDKNTTNCIDCTTGKIINADELKEGMKVYIQLKTPSSDDIKTVFVLNDNQEDS